LNCDIGLRVRRPTSHPAATEGFAAARRPRRLRYVMRFLDIAVYTENLIRVDDVMESPELAE